MVSGRSLLGTMMPGMAEYTSPNGGTHIVHTGGNHASYLQLPIKEETMWGCGMRLLGLGSEL